VTASNASAPDIRTVTDELVVLSQIMRRVAKLSRASRVWLRDRLAADLAGDLEAEL
jgi:hypothetical protein